MKFNLRKRIKIAPGVRVNLGKKGFSSVSFGGKVAKVNVSKKGSKTTIREPKTGLSYSSIKLRNKSNQNLNLNEKMNSKYEWTTTFVLIVIFVIFLIWIIS